TATNAWVYPLASAVITPSSYKGPVRGRHFVYEGSHELAYLHPARFKPSVDVVTQFGLKHSEPFSIVRLVSWTARHDRKLIGLKPDHHRQLVQRLSPNWRALISSEDTLTT